MPARRPLQTRANRRAPPRPRERWASTTVRRCDVRKQPVTRSQPRHPGAREHDLEFQVRKRSVSGAGGPHSERTNPAPHSRKGAMKEKPMLTETSLSPSRRVTPERASDFATDSARYEAVRSRDPRAEGSFFYAVLTTGVYCRPTCAARLALRENVRFHATPDAAEQAGFRPCKRCQARELPRSDREALQVARLRTQLEAAEARRPGRASEGDRSRPATAPARVQEAHRHDPAGLRGCPPAAARERRPTRGHTGHRGALRSRLLLEQPLLRRRKRRARHASIRAAARWRGRSDAGVRSCVLAWSGADRHHLARGLRDPARRRARAGCSSSSASASRARRSSGAIGAVKRSPTGSWR